MQLYRHTCIWRDPMTPAMRLLTLLSARTPHGVSGLLPDTTDPLKQEPITIHQLFLLMIGWCFCLTGITRLDGTLLVPRCCCRGALPAFASGLQQCTSDPSYSSTECSSETSCLWQHGGTQHSEGGRVCFMPTAALLLHIARYGEH